MKPLTFVPGYHCLQDVNKMTYHPLGTTGLMLSRMSLGGGPFGELYGAMNEETCKDVVNLALKSGVNYIDTAPWYGNGRSEELLGKALKDIPRKCYYIGTKVGRYENHPERMFDFSAKRVAESVDRSLKLLGLDYVDVIQVHDLEFADSLDVILKETLPALQKVVENGKARFIGITGYPLSTLKEVIEKSPVKINTVLSYARNTLFDDTLKHYMPYFKSKGIGVISASPVGMGLLTQGTPPSWHPAPKEIKDACRSAALYCEEVGTNLSHLAVQHSLLLEGAATHLIGNNTSAILRRNLDTYLTPPTERDEELRKLVKERFFDKLKVKHWEGVELIFKQQRMAAKEGRVTVA